MLSLNVLGVPQARYGPQPLAVRGKPLGLLCWLALHGPASRSEAAELLWPGEGSATLRQHLYLLRKLPGAAQWWSGGSELRVQVQTDVDFLGRPLNASGQERALEVLAATLLEGLEHLPDPFVEWLELERQRLALLRRTLLFETALGRLERGEPDAAAERLSLLLTLDPLHESACRELMRLEAARGRSAAALSHFETLRDHLRREMDASPLPETVELARRLASSPLTVSTASPSPVSPTLRQAVAAVGSGRPELLAQMLGQDSLTLAAQLDLLSGEEAPVSAAPHLLALLHARAAEALEALDGPGEAVADHWLRAGRKAEAAATLLRAAGAAGSTLEAARLARLALDGGLTGAERAQALALVFAQTELTRDARALAAVNAELAALAFALQDDAVYFQLYRQRAVEARLTGDLEGALNWAGEALAVARRVGQTEWQAETEGLRGTLLYLRGHLPEAEEALRRGLVAEGAVARMRAHSSLGAVYGMSGRLPEALEQQEISLTLSRAHAPRTATAQVLFNLANTALQAGRWPRATEGFREAVLLFREVGAAAYEGQSLAALAHLHLLSGRFGEAWNTAHEVLDFTSAAPATGTVTALNTVAEVHRRCGALPEARAWQERALEAARALEQPRLILLARHNLMLLDVAGGHLPTPDLLPAMEEAGMTLARGECQAELALLAPDAATFAWAADLQPPPDAPITGPLLSLARLRASLRGWLELDTPEDPGKLRLALPREGAYALTLWARRCGARNGPEQAARLREEAAALAKVQAQGLPRALRDAYRAGVERGLPWG